MASRWSRITLTAAGLVAGAATAGVGVERLLMARERRRSDPVGERAIPDLAESEERVVTISDGTEVHVLERGEGPAIVLVHGVTLSADIWRCQLADLAAAGYRVLAPDLRGHGRTPAGDGPLSVEQLGQDLAEVLEVLDVTGAVVVGHSLGGMVLLSMLADDPATAAGRGRVAGLVLVGTSASPANGLGLPAAGALMRVVNPLAVRGALLTSRLPGGVLPPGDLAYLLTRGVFGSHPSHAAVELTRTIVAATPARVVAELAVAVSVFDQRPSLEHIGVPTTVVVGSRDTLTPVSGARDMVSRIRRAQLVVLPECGHMAMLERRQELDLAIEQLARRAGAGRAERDARLAADAPVHPRPVARAQLRRPPTSLARRRPTGRR